MCTLYCIYFVSRHIVWCLIAVPVPWYRKWYGILYTAPGLNVRRTNIRNTKAGCIKKIIIVAHVELVQNIILISIGSGNITPICSLRSPHHVAQYRRRYLGKSDSPKAFRGVLLVMSETLLGNHFSHDIQKVVAISVMAAISNPVIHGDWLPVNQFREYRHESTPLAII